METPNTEYLQVATRIRAARRVLLLNPEGGDGDSFGATIALSRLCGRLGVPADVFALHASRSVYGFLPNFSGILTEPGRLDYAAYDCIIACDIAHLGLTGLADLSSSDQKTKTIINIDHHATNQRFGTMNIVDAERAAACELVYDLARASRWALDAGTATCLLTGIVSDTGMFAYRNTTDRTLAIAAHLLRCGARLNIITAFAYRRKSVGTLHLLGTALTRLTRDAATGLVTTYLTRADFSGAGVDETAAEGIANFLNILGNEKGVVFLKELPGNKVKGSVRTMQDDIDCAQLARQYGGGGHRRAAGFVLDGTIDDIRHVWNLSPSHDILTTQ